MDAKHTPTPGPWVAKFDETYSVRHAADGSLIATVTFVHLRGRRRPEEVAANARLISAAPDMLAILQVVADDPGIVNSVEWHSAVLDALAKATQQPASAGTEKET